MHYGTYSHTLPSVFYVPPPWLPYSSLSAQPIPRNRCFPPEPAQAAKDSSQFISGGRKNGAKETPGRPIPAPARARTPLRTPVGTPLCRHFADPRLANQHPSGRISWGVACISGELTTQKIRSPLSRTHERAGSRSQHGCNLHRTPIPKGHRSATKMHEHFE